MLVVSEDDKEALASHLSQLHEEHRDLDLVIARLAGDPALDELQLRRLKKRKLYLKDQITAIENRIGPHASA
jgi:hypothetical protein